MKECLPLITLLASAGCVTASPAPTAIAYLPTRSFEPDVASTALAKGVLRVRDGCVRIVGKGGGAGALVIWPKGSRLVGEGHRQIVIMGGSDQRLTVGSRVRLGGGGSDSFPLEMLTTPPPAGCAGPYFSAG